jgi:hypothetical protein
MPPRCSHRSLARPEELIIFLLAKIWIFEESVQTPSRQQGRPRPKRTLDCKRTYQNSHSIFESTSEIQQFIISHAISGKLIEYVSFVS